MQFYKRLAAFKVLSFDLDDTLYSNYPNMVAAEQAMASYFAKLTKKAKNLPRQFWLEFRRQALEQDAQLANDVTKLRIVAYTLALQHLGFAADKAEAQANKAVAHFLYHRSNFKVPKASIELLQQLQQKYAIIAITNGNVDVERVGLGNIFQLVLHPGLGFQRKPYPAMFEFACAELQVLPQQILHIGDCGHADVQGALQAGCQTAWYSQHKVGKPLKNLPHFQFTNLNELTLL